MLEKSRRSYFRCSMNVETASLIFAMIKCIISSFATLIFVFALIIFISTGENLLSAASLVVVCLVSIPFYYSMLLARGIMTKNSEYVKIYFTYGITSSVYLLAFAIALKILPVAELDYGDLNKFNMGADFFSYISPVCTYTVAAYIPILILIRYTYLKIERQSQFRKLYAQNLALESHQILKKPDV